MSNRRALVLLIAVCANSVGGVCQQSRSQSEEESIVNECFFKGMRNGTFVELGALDGELYSNTLMLDTCFGWHGVLVEGSRANFQSLLRNVRRLRRRVTINYGAVCSSAKTVVHFARGRGPVAGDVSQMSHSFKMTWYKTGVRVVTVPCKTMAAYLEPLTHVDFFSLDIEGAELEALLTLDFQKVSIDVFMIEMDEHDEDKNWKIRRLLANLGYSECPGVVPRSGLFVHSRRREWQSACAASCGRRLSPGLPA
jgi:FkbM family methyltransferase